MIGPATIGCSAQSAPPSRYLWVLFPVVAGLPLSVGPHERGLAVRRRRVTRTRTDRLVWGRHHRQHQRTVVFTDLRPPRLDHLLTRDAVAEGRVAPGRYIALCDAVVTPSTPSSGRNCQPCLRANLIPTQRRASVKEDAAGSSHPADQLSVSEPPR